MKLFLLAIKNIFIRVILKNLNIKKLASSILDEALEPALDKVVKDSKNPYDNMAMATLYPVLKEKLTEAIDEKLDIDKLIK